MASVNRADFPVEVVRPRGEMQTIRLGSLPPYPHRLPLVSCLMVSRGNVTILRHSLQCYLNQDYPSRELVLVTQHPSAELADHLSSFPDAHIRYVEAAPGMTLGEMRNVALAHGSGTLVCTWDDDDLHHPQRLSATITALLSAGAAAAFLSRYMLWWPARNIAALSNKRPWEFTMVALRSAVPAYPALARGSDTFVVDAIRSHHAIGLLNVPGLYWHVSTGANTWDESHFEELLRFAERRFEAEEYGKVVERFARSMPIKEYAAVLAGAGAPVP